MLDNARIIPSRCRCCGKFRRDCTCRYGSMDEPRAIIRHFAQAMERKLAEYDQVKSGWRDAGTFFLLGEMHQEVNEFVDELNMLVNLEDDGAPEDIMTKAREALLREAADVSNYLAMICDVMGALPPTDERGR